MRRKLLLVLLAAVICLSGCGAAGGDGGQTEAPPAPEADSGDAASAGSPVALEFFNISTELVDFWDAYYDGYNQSNGDGIQVTHTFAQDGHATLRVRLASGDAPDFTNMQSQNFIDSGIYVDISGLPHWDKIDPAMKELTKDYNTGKNFSLPMTQSCWGLFYNRALYDELGLVPADTWEEFVENQRAIKAAYPDKTPLYLAGATPWTLRQMGCFTAEQHAKQNLGFGEYMAAMQNADFDTLMWSTDPDTAIARWAQCLMDLMEEGLINDNILTATYDDKTAAFAAGEAASFPQGLWAASEVKSKVQEESDLEDFAFSHLPAVLPGDKPSVGSLPDVELMILDGTPHQEAILTVWDTLMEDENMARLSVARQAPTTNGLDTDWGYLQDSVSQTLALDHVAKINWGTYPPGLTDEEIGNLWQLCFTGSYADGSTFAEFFLDNWEEATR